MRRQRVVIPALFLFLLNAWIAWRLFGAEYIGQLGSIEGTHIALGRWVAENWNDLIWFPLWYGGIPWQNTYSPLHPVLVAGAASLTGVSAALAYHALTAVFYSLGPVTLFWLALRLTGAAAPAFLGGLFYSLISPASFLIPVIRHDAGSVWHPRRLQALVEYGEGPHIAAMAMAPLAVLLVDLALEKRRPLWWILAALSLAAVALTNWLGAAAVGFALVALLLGNLRGRGWGLAVALGLYAYAITSPWIPLSAVFHIQSQEKFVSGSLPAERWLYAVAGALTFLLLLWIFRRLSAPGHLRFSLLFLFPVAVVTLVAYQAGVDLLPQAGRYHLEMEMCFALLGASIAKLAFERLSRRTRVVVVCLLLLLCVLPLTLYRHKARGMIQPIDIRNTIEYREARWFERNMGGGRVFAPGSISFFLNVFTSIAQYGGGFDQGVINPVYPAVHYQILSGDNAGESAGEVAILWLKAFGVDAVGVSGPLSEEHHKPIRDFRKFDGLLRELWREGDDVIYDVPRRSRSLAHVMRRNDLAARRPAHGLDVDPARSYVAALESLALPAAEFRWKNHHEAAITAIMERDHILSVQISYHPGWSARVNGRPCRTYGDALGQLVIEPACEGSCAVDLRFDSGLEVRLLRWLSIGALVGGVVWVLAGWRRRV